MKIGITPLIAENIAPTNAKSLVIFDGDRKVCNVDISKMKPQNLGTKLYSFGLISDSHVISSSDVKSTFFNNVLSFFDGQEVSFVAHCGDMTNHGFWNSDGTKDLSQFAEYKRVRNIYPNLPVYGVCGNHESYFKDITETLSDLKTYTGNELTYTVSQGNDLFIFIGQNAPSSPMRDSDLQWLYETLESNRNKRCFIFVHSVIDDTDSGDPFGIYANDTFDWWGTKKEVFINLLSHYENTMIFHGHTHVHPRVQTKVNNINYSTVLGFRSFHVPSTAYNRDVDMENNALVEFEASLGYLAEVYEDCIVFKGYDFVENDIIPIAQYRIDTTIKIIEANTFTDSTGTITT